MAQAGFIEVQKCLAGISYPASREDLIAHAKDHGADKGILAMLADLPDTEYDGPNNVSSAVAKS